MTITLPEELLLLAYHDETGRNKSSFIDYGLAGAVLMELVLAERLDLVDKRVNVVNATPLGDPILDECLARIGADKRRKAQHWVTKLTKLRPRLLETLEAKGIIRHRQDRVLGLLPFNRYLPVDGRTEEATLVAALTRMVDAGSATDARLASLGSLVYAIGIEHVVFPDRKRSAVRKTLKGISAGDWASSATIAAIQAAQAAIAAAVTASTVAATSSGG
ncbi:GOLPH3/VPS74 family protein [Stackebrandtia soli]|uniref:GOLPH3/VPS74 family protein n=1 Tax=Stackebrandtia soli TaxID=1892856 RepID=UPI0039E7D72C